MTSLEQRVAQAKTRYSVALRNLEQISEQIHARRLQRLIQRRESPVGSECGTVDGAEGPQSDSVSVLSLRTIASDLQKFDSVEHLLGFSDVSSLRGEGEEAMGGRGGGGEEEEEEEEDEEGEGGRGGTAASRRGGRGRFRHHRSVSL